MKLDASVLGVVGRRDPVDVQKISSRVCAGQVIETVDGSRFRVTSKVSDAGGAAFHLSTPTGTFCVTAAQLADMEPLPPALMRLAHVLRFYAYNRDFDQYVKEALRANRLPIDPKMNWSRWFQAVYVPKLSEFMRAKGLKPDPQTVDEAIHATIVDALFSRDGLAKFRPAEKRKGKGYTEDRGRQVTKFVENLFTYEIPRAKREIIRLTNVVPVMGPQGGELEGRGTPMEVPSRDDESQTRNILETEEFSTSPHEELESWSDVARFRAAYGQWLEKNSTPGVTEDILKLFDLIILAEKMDTGTLSYKQDWMDATGKSLSYYQIIASKLSETLQDFVAEHPELAETSLIARLIADIKTKKPTTERKVEGVKSVPRAASLALVAAAPSELAQMPGDTGQLPHDNTGNESSAVIVLDEKPAPKPPTVAPEIPAIRHGF